MMLIVVFGGVIVGVCFDAGIYYDLELSLYAYAGYFH